MSGHAHHRRGTLALVDGLDADLRRGLCVAHPTFPAHYWDSDVDGETQDERTIRLATARGVCNRCPVAEACLAEHRRGVGGGVRAGTPYVDTIAATSTNGRDTYGVRQRPPCGTPGGKRAHVYRGEAVCEACDEAYREWNRDRVAVQRENAEAAS